METDIISILLKYYLKFKSYYVVWKQTCVVYSAPGNDGFKSYYVVWKHFSNPTKNFCAARLNRTM